MNIIFHIEYHTIFGEELVLNIVGNEDTIKSYRMTTDNGIDWSYCFNDVIKSNAIEYFYSVTKNGTEIRKEWTTIKHQLNLKIGKTKYIHVFNRWSDIPEDNYLYSSAFTECIQKLNIENTNKLINDKYKSSAVIRFIVRAPQLNGQQQLAITGNSEELGCWNINKVLPLSLQNYNEWTIDIPRKTFENNNVSFKFVAINKSDKEDILWEICQDRQINIPKDTDKNSTIVYELQQASFPISNLRFAGTLVPVFSLRTKDSFGVGDFGDLKHIIDWVATTKQRILQVLPINDTTANHTWTDSYPYSCISVFALHPQYVDLRQLPLLKDEKYRKHFESLQKELNALPQIDYERVNNAKTEYLQILFQQEGIQVIQSEEFKTFLKEKGEWLTPYAKYCLLRDQTGTTDFSQWKGNETWKEDDRKALTNPRTKKFREVVFYYYVQFILYKQMQEAHEYAREKGVILKGDIPIGVSRVGCDVWMEPRYFNLDGQAGAPPDSFSIDGQNWGFPTYNWDEMLKDGCKWWIRRFQNMSLFFDAYRIDHVLGFFRIWEIPIPHSSGLEGYFSPALGLSTEEINNWGIYNEIERLFLTDKKNKSLHPRINAQYTEAYNNLPHWEKDAFNRLYNYYFYRRNDNFWAEKAIEKLSKLVQSTRMLVCAEDLGMVPDCVQGVMNELRILSLELESMPKESNMQFGLLHRNPYRSVCTISSHDMPTLRMWWDENIERAQTYYNQILHKDGPAPHPMPGWLASDIISANLSSPSMLCIIALQDWLAIDEKLRLKKADDERINIPANPKNYWRYRMHINIEDMIANKEFSTNIEQLITSHRN